nr:DNA mismatch repair protein MutS [Actinomycetota bacterium]
MAFNSILFEKIWESAKKEKLETPPFFVDLNLDQIIDAICAGRQEYDLKPFFYAPLGDVDSITYRHEIFRDLESKDVFEKIKSFAQKMRIVREHLVRADKLYYKPQKERFFLEAVEIYCDAISGLVNDLSRADLKSHGLKAFREYLADYTSFGPFMPVLDETKELLADLSSIKYNLLIKDNSVKVSNYGAEADYSSEVEETFDKFKQGAVKDYLVQFPDSPDMNHVEAKILEFVANLNPDVFSRLDDYYMRNVSFLDQTIAIFDREIQFYVAYLEFIEMFKRAGLKFCYPCISAKSKEVYDYEEFDLALARRLLADKSDVVCNDFYLKGRERILVV